MFIGTVLSILAGNTGNYLKYYRENALTAGVYDATKGTTSYTFTNIVPADATGSWTVSADIYRNATLKRADGITQGQNDTHPLYYYSSDKNPGDFKGHGVGGVWHVLSPRGSPMTNAAPSPAP